MICMRAPAKLNLVLEILGKRSDGFHNISSIMQTVGLFDELSFEQSDKLELHCNIPELEIDDNLVLKAARILKQKCGYSGGAAIRLNKRIPLDSGLGGGSSNAATALLALNKLWSAGCNIEELIKMGAEIGSDVPFFLRGGTCIAEGRGEWITALPDIQQRWFVLIRPEVTVPRGKTANMYKMVTASVMTGGEYTSAARDFIVKDRKITGHYLYNAFDALAFPAYPGLDVYWDQFKKAGAMRVHIAGAGPVLFTMLGEKSRTEALAIKLRSMQIEASVIPSLPRNEIGY